MRVVFFGTPAFAVPTLQRLLDAGHDVAAVVTQPDRPQGRSRSQLVPPPVKTLALAHGIPVWQPERPRGEEFVTPLRGLGADVGVVVAYGHILRPEVLAAPAHGMVNVHASLLPHLRGAAPIQWAIRRGDAGTGVTIMRMEAGLDSGPTYLARRTPITAEDTAATLTERLSRLGADALVEALEGIARGALVPCPQDHALATYAPKIDRDTARIPWHEPASVVDCHVRAFDPVPGAWTTLEGADVKLFGTRASNVAVGQAPGTVLAADDALVVATGAGTVTIAEAQPAGRKRRPVADWTHGRGVRAGQVFA